MSTLLAIDKIELNVCIGAGCFQGVKRQRDKLVMMVTLSFLRFVSPGRGEVLVVPEPFHPSLKDEPGRHTENLVRLSEHTQFIVMACT